MATKKTNAPKVVRHLLIDTNYNEDRRVTEVPAKNLDRSVKEYFDNHNCGCDQENLVIIAVYSNGTVKRKEVEERVVPVEDKEYKVQTLTDAKKQCCNTDW